MKKPSPYPRLMIALLILGVGVAISLMWMQKHRAANARAVDGMREIQKPADASPPTSEQTAKTVETPIAPSSEAKGPPQFDSFRLRPFAAVKITGTHEWTAEDARSTEAIRALAHNEVEVARLLDENSRIKRRQLVYRNETVPMLMQLAQATGQPLRSFTLPGLDGKEVEVEVTATNVVSGAQAGSVMGRVKGRFDSLVTVGFSNGCESFNITSPTDQLFLTADAREPGEVLVKEIDPDEYTRPPGQTPDFILTQDPPPGQTPKPQSR